jgi:hypothetical protein
MSVGTSNPTRNEILMWSIECAFNRTPSWQTGTWRPASGPKRKVDIDPIYSDNIFNEILVRTLMQGGEYELTKKAVQSVC